MILEKKALLLSNPILMKFKSFLNDYFIEIFYLLCCFVIYHGSTFYSFDGLYYFAQLISIFEDGDLDIYNNLKNFPLPIREKPNEWSIGPAIFWAPFYLIGHLIYDPGVCVYHSITGFYPEYMQVFYYNICLVNLGTLFYTYLGLKILGIALNKYYLQKFSPKLVQVAVFLCTPLLFYVFDRPLMAHAISFFTISIVMYFWVKWHERLNYKQVWWIFFTLGIASLVRWQNILFSVFFLPQIQKTITHWIKEYTLSIFLKSLLTSISLAVLGFLIAFSPQLIAWWVQFGVPISTVHDISKFTPLTPSFREVWFGQHGFFVWHPISVIFIIGLLLFFVLIKLSKSDGFVLLLGFLLQSYLWAIWYSPAAGCSFGMRGLIECLPLLAFGFANITMIGRGKSKKSKVKINLFLGIIVFFFSLMNLYMFALIGHFYGMPIITCASNFRIEWFLSINWEIILKTYNPGVIGLNLPFYRIEKILVLLCLGILIASTCSRIKKFELKKTTINKRE